ncbi:MAG TPA: aminotransferase class V-fold PLP-dependent enzyme [Gaiella sp.]
MNERELLARTAAIAADYLETLDTRPVRPDRDYRAMVAALDRPVPEHGSEAAAVLEELAAAAEPGIMAIGSGRWYGFVAGGAVPSSLAADWLVSAWDQNTCLAEPTPATSALEAVTGRWVLELLGLPAHSSFAFVTGCQMAHVTCLAAARHAVYRRVGWDLPERGLAGAPPLRVILGGKRHVTIKRALRLLGIGESQEVVLPADSQGRMETDQLASALDGSTPTIVCAQAGEVNTGAFDDLGAIVELAGAAGAWVHVDGAFGLWAAASPKLAHLVAGHERADSWATDGHKWLNVPFDCGIAMCAHPDDHEAAMEYAAPYLAVSESHVARDPMGYSPEFSRRARAVPVWAAIRELGREGITDLVERCCAHARTIAEGLASLPGCEIVNDVVLNQVLVRFEDDERTLAILGAVQDEGEAWMSPTTWDGRQTIRISVVGWRTTERDVERTVAAFERAAGAAAE